MSRADFEIIPGSADSAVILHVPHSSRFIPEDIRQGIILSDQSLEHELDKITDTLTDFIANEAVKKLDSTIPTPWLFINRLSRLVVDPERFPDDREIMNQIGMGAVYTKSTSGEQLRAEEFDKNELLSRFFFSYSKSFTNLVSERFSGKGYCLIIDVHSYRKQQHLNALNHSQIRPQMCMGTNNFHTPEWLKNIFQNEFSQIGECIENQPYSGTYIPLEFFEIEERVWSVMMETRADTFLDDCLSPHQGLEKVTSALASLISAAQKAIPH